MSPFHCPCPHCGARLGSRRPVPPGRSLQCPCCNHSFTAPQTGTRKPPPGLPPPVEFGLWKDASPRESFGASTRRGVARRFPGGTPALAGAALVLTFLLGAAAADFFRSKQPADQTGWRPPAAPVVVTAPTLPAPTQPATPRPADPPVRQKPPPAPPSAQQLLIGRWEERHALPELGLTLHFVMTFEKDGTFSMRFAPPPASRPATAAREQTFGGVYHFRSPTVADFEWKTLPKEIDVGVTTCTVRFVDRNLLILTSVLTGEKRELRRIQG